MKIVRWLVFAAVTASCVALGYGAYTLAGISWDAVVSYESPYARLDLPPTADGAVESSRTVLVIIDGLRLDASRNMGTLERLRNYGSDLVLTAPQPSLSYPNWTTILSGASPYISGVVTNWHEGPAPVETVFDTLQRAGRTTVFVGPEDFEQLFGVSVKTTANYMRKWDKRYMTAEYVDAALALVAEHDPQALIVHLPDVDEAGHAQGGASAGYSQTVARIDADLGRLVDRLQDGHTTFVVVADHGHIDTGGHGGWEAEATQVPCIVAGPGVGLGAGTGPLEGVAPTFAVLTGSPTPRFARAPAFEQAFSGPRTSDAERTAAAVDVLATAHEGVVLGALGSTARAVSNGAAAEGLSGEAKIDAAEQTRLSVDRSDRLLFALMIGIAGLIPLLLIGVSSWRALVASAAGVAAYYLVYNLLFFVVHGYRWSLSAFNSEDRIAAWMNMRLVEAAVAALVAAAVAGLVYPLLRHSPKPARGRYLAGWLTLGPASALATLGTLVLQVAWFFWAWGIFPVWRLPDLRWGFKYDLDLIQATAIGFVAVLTPLVTFVIGRYHPKVRTVDVEE